VARRHGRSDEIIIKFREAKVLLSQGMKVAKVVKGLDIRRCERGLPLYFAVTVAPS